MFKIHGFIFYFLLISGLCVAQTEQNDSLIFLPEFCTRTRVAGFHFHFNFHEEPFGIIKLDASSREAGQDSGIRLIVTASALFEILIY